METEHRICFKRLTQQFNTIFYYTFQEGSKLKLLNIDMIQSKYGISIDQTDHIMKDIIQEYWGTKIKDEVKFQKSTFPTDTSFEQTLFMSTPLIVSELKQIEKTHGGSLNHWFGGLMNITVQTCYDLQYLTIQLSGYMNASTEPAFLALKHGMEYLMHHPHEPIMHPRKKIHRTEESPHQCYFKAGDVEISRTKE